MLLTTPASCRPILPPPRPEPASPAFGVPTSAPQRVSPSPPCFPFYPASPKPPQQSTASQPWHPQTLPQTCHLPTEARTCPTKSPRYKDFPTAHPSKPARDKSSAHSDNASAEHSHPNGRAAIPPTVRTAATSSAARRLQ